MQTNNIWSGWEGPGFERGDTLLRATVRTETLFEANILSYILLSQPYTQVHWFILTIMCLFNLQVTLLRESKRLLYGNFN